MGDLVNLRLKFANFPRGVPTNAAPAEVISFPLSARADAFDRQASSILARSIALNLTALQFSIQVALCIAGLHTSNDRCDPCKKISPTQRKRSPNDGSPE